MHPTEKLLSEGYKTYRLIQKSNWNKDVKKQAQKIMEKNKENVFFKQGDFDSDESSFYVPCSFNSIYLASNFNAMQVGGLEVHFIKNKRFCESYVFGLFALGDPPTWIGRAPKLAI